jgi:hypothetical protein
MSIAMLKVELEYLQVIKEDLFLFILNNYEKMIKYLISVFFTFIPAIFLGQMTISGTVKDSQTGEHLSFIEVYNPNGKQGTLTNEYGFFSLTLPKQAAEVCFRGTRFQVACIPILVDTVLTIDLVKSSDFFVDTVTISKPRVIPSHTGQLVIPVEQLEYMPSLLGQSDALKGLQMLPGVQFGVEGTAGLYVRGGSPDQNLILLDEIPVYNVSHLFGFFSLFPPEALKSVELYRGGFPARYGGRLSSVIKLQTKDGNMKEWEKKISIGLVSGSLSLEGPLIKDKSSVFFSARRSWIDLLMRPGSNISLARQEVNGSFGYNFHDFIGKVNYKLSDKTRFFLSVYGGRDQNDLNVSPFPGEDSILQENEGVLRWGNITASLRMNHIYNSKLFSNTTLGYTQYRYRSWLENVIFNREDTTNYTRFENASLIRDLIFKHSFEYYPTQRQQWRFGLELSRQSLSPDVQLARTFQGNSLVDTSFNAAIFDNYLAAPYIEHVWQPNDRLYIQSGIRAEWMKLQSQEKPQLSIQPRVNIDVKLTEKLSLKGAYSYVRQYLHLLSSSGLALPADIWAPATGTTPPAFSHQITSGFSYQLPYGMSMSLEGYYKVLGDIISYRDGATYFGTFENWENKIARGTGSAYGGEIFIHKPEGRLNGWLSYTYSRSFRRFEGINNGRPFPFRFDRPHNFSLNLSYALKNPNHRLSLSWMFVSGARATIPTKRYTTPFDLHEFLQGYGENPLTLQTTYLFYNSAFFSDSRNNFQMTPFHKMDISYSMTKEKKNYNRTFTVGIYNLYGQRNPLYVFFDGTAYFDENLNTYDARGRIIEYSFLMWIPAISYAWEF